MLHKVSWAWAAMADDKYPAAVNTACLSRQLKLAQSPTDPWIAKVSSQCFSQAHCYLGIT